MEFLALLKKNAYETLNVEDHTLDIHGWMDSQFVEVFSNHLQKYDRPLTIVEVGSWKGLSCAHMADTCKRLNKNAQILAIDTWLGAPEFWTWGINDPTRGVSLNLQNGYPSVFYTFTKNIKKLGFHDIVAPLPLSSICAVQVLKYYKIKPDIIYIDAGHEYESVKADIEAYLSVLNEGGMIFGDDYNDNWAGVKRAVNETFGETKNVTGIVWHYTKGV
jgi:hypothetical protein